MKTLILTVGVGTGENSTIDYGLEWTIKTNQPEKLILLHTSNPKSKGTAEALPEQVGITNYELHLIPDPDNLQNCIQQIKNLAELDPKNTTINGFSGTKTMSAAASIAAIEAECLELQFTTGKREKGTVIHGTESLEKIDPTEIFKIRDIKLARQLFEDGAYHSAKMIFQNHNMEEEALTSQCRLCWENEDFEGGRQAAAQSNKLEPWRGRLNDLATAAKTKHYGNIIIIEDILQTAKERLKKGRLTDTYFRIGKTIEFSFKAKIELICGKREPYTRKDFPNINTKNGKNGTIRLDIKDSTTILKNRNIKVPKQLKTIYDERSEIVHELPRTMQKEAEKHLIELEKTLVEWIGIQPPPPRPNLP